MTANNRESSRDAAIPLGRAIAPWMRFLTGTLPGGWICLVTEIQRLDYAGKSDLLRVCSDLRIPGVGSGTLRT